MRRLAVLVFFLLIALALAWGADFWTRKPFSEWSEKEVKRLLSDSPWAKTFTLRDPVLMQSRREVGKFSTTTVEGEGPKDPEVDYIVYLRTAQPVREALVRSAQLEQKYDRMDDAARQAFDARWRQFLASPVADKIIFHVRYSSNITDIDRKLANYWQTQTLDSLLPDTYMTTSAGKRVSPVAFWVGKGGAREFQLAFPRPAAEDRDAALAVEFKVPDMFDPALRTSRDAVAVGDFGQPPRRDAGTALNQQEDIEARTKATLQRGTRLYLKFSLKEMEYKGAVTY